MLSPRNSAFTLATCCSTTSATSCDTFSFTCARQLHWPEVAADRRYQHAGRRARRLVASHVASVRGLSNKLPNLCPSPFTLGHKFGKVAELVRQHVASVKAP